MVTDTFFPGERIAVEFESVALKLYARQLLVADALKLSLPAVPEAE